VAGHWVRDGLCKPEDVAAKVARDYAALQMQQQLSQQQEQIAAISPPGMNTDHIGNGFKIVV
jgi:hypothetical protein